MARLPVPGSDDGKWGQILNEYLGQAHDASGNLKPNTVGSSQLQDGSVTSTALADASVTSAKLASGAVTKSDVGLGSVDNTSDADKPVSSATQTALDTKLAIAALDSETAAKISDGGSATGAALSASLARVVSVDAHGAVGDGVADDMAAIEAAITALAGRGVLRFSGNRTYKTSGGHVLPVGTIIDFGGATIVHTGNNTCFSWNQAGAFNLDRPAGCANLRLQGNSGTNAIGIEFGNCWGWRGQALDIEGYSNGVALQLTNETNWTEGATLDGVKIGSSAVGVRFHRDGGEFSFGYTRTRNLAINVPAGGVGIDIGGASVTATYLYNSDLEANLWLLGDGAIGVRVGPNASSDSNRIHIVGEVPNSLSLTGAYGLQNQGGNFRGYGHFRVKDAANDTALGFTRITASYGLGILDKASGGNKRVFFSSNPEVGHEASFGWDFTTGSTPFVSGVDTGPVFQAYKVPSGSWPDSGTRVFQVGNTGNLKLGSVDVGIYQGTGSPNGVVSADPGSLYLQTNGGSTASPKAPVLWRKIGASGNTGWVPTGESEGIVGGTAAARTIDVNSGSHFLVPTLTANTTITLQSYPLHPYRLTVRLQQDGTGGRTVAFTSAVPILWEGGVVPVASSAANVIDVVEFTSFNGTAFHGRWYKGFA